MPNFLLDLQSVPFHVTEIFDDADEMAWYTSTLIRDVIDTHGPVESNASESLISIPNYGKLFIVEIWHDINFAKGPNSGVKIGDSVTKW